MNSWMEDVYDDEAMNFYYMYKVNRNALVLRDVPDRYKCQEMCNSAVEEDPMVLQYVPDYFVTKEMLKMGVVKTFMKVITSEKIEKRYT